TGAISTSFAFASPGIYTVQLSVDDGCGGQDSANTVAGKSALVFVFDPISSLASGSGELLSPAGSLTSSPADSGKALFSFSCSYNNGALPPKGGATAFQFGSLNFQSSKYDFLVVAGAKGVFRGTGTINGTGNFGFLMTVLDGKIKGAGGIDRLRLKIWDKDNGDAIVYDNQMGAPDTADPASALRSGSVSVGK
ncbi:MAG TPA: hypothetical protein VJX67_13780, partial [Blastocatellia bacterium]|nr:hypothetical protein [Blastocatellia bacterium]